MAIQREITSVQAAAPTLAATLQIVNSNLNWGVTVTGITPEWLEVKEWNLADGRPLTAEDHRTAAKVALLGQTAPADVFGDDNPIGAVIRSATCRSRSSAFWRPRAGHARAGTRTTS